MSLVTKAGLQRFFTGLKDRFAPKNHTHDGRYYTESEIDGKLSGKANSSHTHTKAQVGLGNVDNTADSAKSVKAATKLQTYKQGSTTATYGDSYPLYAQWSGDDVVLKCDNYKVKVNYAENAGTANEINPNNSYGSITKAVRPMFDSVRADRLAFLPSDQIIIEKTVDGGKTWTDAAITDYNKRAMFSENGGGFTLPLIDGKKNALCGIRLTITGMKYNVPAGTAETAKYNYWNSKYVKNTERYCTIGDMFFWVSGGSDDISLVIERATGAASTSWANLFTSSSSTGYLNGWSGPNYIKFSEGTLGGGTGQTSNWWNYRFTFMSHPGNGSAFNSNYITQAQNVTMIKAYGASVWNASNNLMSNDHMYGWDVDKNVTFPARVSASGFNGAATKLARDGDLANPMTFNWSGKDGQPTWLWGGEDGSNMYVYNPSKFNVNSAKTAASADSAKKLTTNAGSATQPVYFSNGVPVATIYTLGKSVPANAVFTDTNTWRGVQNNLTSDSTDQSLSAAQGKALKALVDGKAAASHTHTKAQVGLGNVDNTADSAKSVKYATSAGSAESAAKANRVADYNATSKSIQIGYSGDGITGDAIKYIAGYTTGDGGDVSAKIKDISKDALKGWIGSLPANGGNSTTVNGHSINSDVPAGAKFTDTTYGMATASSNGLMTAADKAKLNGIASNANNYSHPTSSGNKHIPAGGSAGQILRWSADGTATWGSDNNTTYSAFKGATSSAAGGAGLVPAPGTADVGKVLKGSGAWGTLGKSDVGLSNVDNTADSAKSVKYATSAGSATNATNDSKSQAITGYIRGLSVSGRTVTYTRGDGTTGSITTQDSNTTYGNMTGATANASGKAGLVPAPAAGTQGSKYLRADGTWQTPPDTNTTYGTASQSANGLMSAADKKKLDGIASGANNYTYSLPTASATVLGGVKTGSNITNTGGVLSLTKANVTSALGYTPPTTNTTYGNATKSSSGLMSSSDKSKLDGIASGANKTVVDSTISQSSTNPVQNGVITKRLQFLYSFKISRDKWNESSDKSNWNVIVPWSDSKGTAITGSTTGTPNLTTNMSLGPAMMERTSSLKDNIILSGELSMINQGQIYVCDTNKLSFTVKRRPVCDLMLYFYARQWTT